MGSPGKVKQRSLLVWEQAEELRGENTATGAFFSEERSGWRGFVGRGLLPFPAEVQNTFKTVEAIK